MAPTARRISRKRASGKRSGFEENIEIALDEHEIAFDYEKVKVPYHVTHIYTPDFRLLRSGVLVEAKGWLTSEDRSKLAHVKGQHPDLDLRVLFEKQAEAARPIRPGSMTSNADWLQAHGIPWAAGALPVEWTLERNLAVATPGAAGDPDYTDPRTWADAIPILTAKQRRDRAASAATALVSIAPNPGEQAPAPCRGPRPKREAVGDKPKAPRRRAS